MAKLVDAYNRTVDYLRVSPSLTAAILNASIALLLEAASNSLMTKYSLMRKFFGQQKPRFRPEFLKYESPVESPSTEEGWSGSAGCFRISKVLKKIAVTTNGILLKELAGLLFEAGVRRINVSLDTLKPGRFKKITGGDLLYRVLEGIEASEKVGLSPIKINTVVMRGINDDEIENLAGLTLKKPYHVRFIELMPTQGHTMANHHSLFVPLDEIINRVKMIGNLELASETEDFGPAKRYSISGAPGKVGFIAPLSRHFCHTCNRLRLTADGKIKNCLFSANETDIKGPLRTGASVEELADIFRHAAQNKPRKHHLNDSAPQNLFGPTMRAIGG